MPLEPGEIAEFERTPAIAAWLRARKLAPDLRDAMWHGVEIEPTHALLLTILHMADRKVILRRGYEAILRECARIVVHHEGEHYPCDADASEQMCHHLSASEIPAADERLQALGAYITSVPQEDGGETERDIEPILACHECADFWRTRPQWRRQRMAAGTIYQPSPLKPARRTKPEIENLKNYIYNVVRENQPMTVRQVFYQMVKAAMVEKTEQEYDNTAGALLLRMRRDGEIPYHWISDNTRWIRKPETFDSIEDALTATAESYRRGVWRDLGLYVEVWCEKDALAGVLYEETARYDVPLMVARGFSSESYLYSVAQTIIAGQRPTWIYYFGDHDPSGRKISEDIEHRLRGFAPGAEIHFERVAVTEGQIVELELPTRPTKREGNSHSRGFVGDSVDLDAIPPLELRRMARECIEAHIPAGHMDVLEAAESSEREILMKIAGRDHAQQ